MYVRNNGSSLTADAKPIELFDYSVHDLLAGFDTDETWPSGPRIICVSSSLKLRCVFLPAPDKRPNLLA